jgi:aryl-alcohol dehydrogenase-like predicted oxidoreductase
VDRARAYDCIDAMTPMAESRGVSVARIALAWMLHHPWVTSVIIGAKTEAQLLDNLASTEVALTDAELAALDAASVLPAECPGWMLDRQGADRVGQVTPRR